MAVAKPAAKKTVAAKKAPSSATKAAAAPAKKGAFGRPAGAAGSKKAPAKKAVKRTPLPTYAAPADFRPHFVLVSFQTDKDGLIGASLKAVRYNGRFDRDADDKKKFNLMDYDPQTVVGIAARLGAVTFKTSIERIMPVSPKEREGFKGSNRLPKSTVFEALIRVAKKSADQTVTAGVRQVFQLVKKTSASSGKTSVKPVELLKTDPAYRLIRRVSRILPPAFKNVLMPPKRTRGSRNQEADDGED